MKNILFLIIVSILASSCITQRRCLTKFPPQTVIERSDSIIYKDTIIYRDRIVYDTIQGDTVIREVKVPMYITKDFKSDPIEAENTYAYAKAWIENQILKLELRLKDQVIKRRIENAEKETTHWREQYYKELYKETQTVFKTRPIDKFCRWFSCIVILLFILYVANRFKKFLPF